MKKHNKSRLVSLIRLLAVFPVRLSLEWQAFLKVSFLLWFLGSTILFPVDLVLPGFFLGFLERREVFAILGRAVLVGVSMSTAFFLLFHLGSIACFYLQNIFRIWRGRLWGSEDSRKLVRLTNNMGNEPMFPPWVYFQQWRLECWWRGLKQAISESHSVRLIKKLCH